MANNITHDRNRCEFEIFAAEALLRGGHPEIDGLCMAIADWMAELRLIETESKEYE